MSASVVRLDDWRDPDRVLARAQRGNPPPLGWSSLLMSNAPGTRDKRTMAATLAKLGLHVHVLHGVRLDGACTCHRGAECPAKHRGKHPVERGWQEAPLNVDRGDALLAREPDFNIGVRTGRQPCGRFLLVVDVDGPRELLAPLEREHGAFPPTLTARTGSGGLHLYYWLADGIEPGNRTGVVPGVDVRGAGGQVVVAPSRHWSGRFYEWIAAREPEVLP